MRIDKFLWCVRYFKTRSIATEACKKGQIKINGDSVKPSKLIFIGENIAVRKDQINYKLQILDIPASRVGPKLVDLYRKDITPPEELEKLDLLKFSKDFYRKRGEGRPTKKDRRDIEDFKDDDN